MNAKKCLAYLEQQITTRHIEDLDDVTQGVNLYFSPNHFASNVDIADNVLALDASQDQIMVSVMANVYFFPLLIEHEVAYMVVIQKVNLPQVDVAI